LHAKQIDMMSKMIKRVGMFFLLVMMTIGTDAQRVLSLDSCRAMALRENKQIGVSKIKQEVAANLRRSMRTKYLPHVNAFGGYMWSSKEISILNDDQKESLNNMGSNLATGVQSTMGPVVAALPVAAQAKMASNLSQVAGDLNGVGSEIVDAFRTDTRNIIAGTVVVTQPLFMGGAIMAANKMADINEDLAANSAEAQRQQTLFTIDKTYWQVVSLRHKQRLAESFVELVKKLDSDVQKMIAEGVATKSDGLSVSVKVNEAEMALTQVTDGLVLSRMLLCQLCGLSMDEQIELEDEKEESDGSMAVAEANATISAQQFSPDNRPELKMLQNSADLAHQTTNLLKAGNLPHLLLTGGYSISNPNGFNGFEKKFAGLWHVGVILHVPVWNWGDVKYKVRASKGATAIANLELDEAREKIELQVSQNNFRVNEAYKKLAMAQSNIARAEENLRTANLGYKEGVISTTTVMQAHTAWLQAQSQKIDAEIDVKLSQVELRKALGTLGQ
jgi:outer membrane protein TolC